MAGSTLLEAPRGKRPSPRAALRQTFRALRNRNYRLFWSGQVISSVGTWMQRIALAWLVLKLTNSPLDLGLVTTFQTLPVLLFALFGGVIADRVAKRRLLLITQSVMLLQASVLALMTAAGMDNLYAIYVLAAILGTASALDNPARQAFVKELVGPDDVANAVALNSIVFNTARLIGPALGGVTIAAVGVTGCFTLNALSFLAVLGGLIMMRPADFYELARPPRGKVLRQIAEGVQYAVRTPDIAVVLLLMLVIGTFGYNFTVILPLIATYVLHAGPVGFGTLTSSMAIGSLVAALGIAYTGRVSQRTLLAGASGFSGLLLLLAVSDRWPTTIAILIALGLFSIIFTATANSRLQLVTPPELRGRVMSLYTLLFMGSTPIGSLVIGAMADHQGVRLAVGELAILCWLGVLAGLLYLRRQRAPRSASTATPYEEPAPAITRSTSV
ncbi:MAG TPA: MFS transporter [Nitrolancea sp.]|nr:MFS transporter [Nitrolancea sp.]